MQFVLKFSQYTAVFIDSGVRGKQPQLKDRKNYCYSMCFSSISSLKKKDIDIYLNLVSGGKGVHYRSYLSGQNQVTPPSEKFWKNKGKKLFETLQKNRKKHCYRTI